MAIRRTAVIIIMLAAVVVAGCVEQQDQQREPLLELPIEEHNGQIYTFSHDIIDTLQTVPVNDKLGVMRSVYRNDRLNIVFNGSSDEDNAYFRVIILNTLAKLQTFFAYEGRLYSDIRAFYHVGAKWYNITNEEIDQPAINDTTGTTLWLVGPNTGANETAVKYNPVYNIVFVEGTDYLSLIKAGDRFVLAVFGIEYKNETSVTRYWYPNDI